MTDILEVQFERLRRELNVARSIISTAEMTTNDALALTKDHAEAKVEALRKLCSDYLVSVGNKTSDEFVTSYIDSQNA